VGEIDDSDMMGDDIYATEGNLNRRLWKATCLSLANEVCLSGNVNRVAWTLALTSARLFEDGARPQPSLDRYERAVFGLLAGDVTQALPLCQSWEDYVWAHCFTWIEYQCEQARPLAVSGVVKGVMTER